MTIIHSTTMTFTGPHSTTIMTLTGPHSTTYASPIGLRAGLAEHAHREQGDHGDGPVQSDARVQAAIQLHSTATVSVVASASVVEGTGDVGLNFPPQQSVLVVISVRLTVVDW